MIFIDVHNPLQNGWTILDRFQLDHRKKEEWYNVNLRHRPMYMYTWLNRQGLTLKLGPIFDTRIGVSAPENSEIHFYFVKMSLHKKAYRYD